MERSPIANRGSGHRSNNPEYSPDKATSTNHDAIQHKKDEVLQTQTTYRQPSPSPSDLQHQLPTTNTTPTTPRLPLILVSIFLVTFLTFLDTSVVATALPRITDDFHSLPDVAWYGSAYQLASASLQPLTGKLYNLFPSKRVYLVFFGLFELGSLICALSSSSNMLIAGRTIAGIGSSGVVNGALVILANSLNMERRVVVTGTLLGFAQIGMVLGPLVGGALTEFSTWHMCFWINFPVGGLAGLLLVMVAIPEQMEKKGLLDEEDGWRDLPRQLHQKLDAIGFLLFSPGPAQLLLALHYGCDSDYDWGSATTIGLFCGAAAAVVVWSAWNWHRHDAALIPFSIALRRPVWASALTQMFLAVSVLVSSFFLPIFFQAVQDVSPLISGLQLLPQIVPQILVAIVGGVAISKTGYPIPYATLGASLAAIGTGLLSLLGPDSGIAMWTGFQIICGVGRGIGSQMPIIAMQSHLTAAESASAMSLLTLAQSLGTSIFVAVSNAILNQSIRRQLDSVLGQAVVTGGVTTFRHTVPPDKIPEVMEAYAKGLDRVFLLNTAAACVAVVTAQGMGWVDIRKKKQQEKRAEFSRGNSELRGDGRDGKEWVIDLEAKKD